MVRTGLRVFVVIVPLVLIVLCSGKIHAETSSSTPTPTRETLESPEIAKEQNAQSDSKKDDEEPPTLFYGFWKRGLYIKDPQKNFELKIGGKIIFDVGYFDSGPEIQAAFPNFEGSAYDWRRLSVSFVGSIKDILAYKAEIDFAHVQDIKDEWIRFPKIPVIKYMTFGHIKEPFSLENLSSLNYITFMERGLPNEPFAPGRNVGILLDNMAKKGRRLTWAFGWFLNTGSYSALGDSRNQIDQANGYNISARVTGLPWYQNEGDKLLHLGLSYNYRNRETANSEPILQFRARPESRLTNDRLISTGEINAEYAHIFDPEIAFVSGPFSLQGEFFYALVDSVEQLRFWGTYFYASVFLTGEQRIYNPSKGTFSAITPHENFEIFRRFTKVDPEQEIRPRYGIGAFELGARYSYVDLEDQEIHGGKEHNMTAGLNWYFKTNIRIMLNYTLIGVNDRDEPPIEADWAHILQTRFQIHF